MFDVLDIIMPSLPPQVPVRTGGDDSAFGPREAPLAYFEDVCIGELVFATRAYSNIERWTGSPARSAWIVLVAGRAASDAASRDDAWACFVRGVGALLTALDVWCVVGASDLDQHRFETLELSPASAIDRLDARRLGGGPLALKAWSPGALSRV
jgi:hypothetical protein